MFSVSVVHLAVYVSVVHLVVYLHSNCLLLVTHVYFYVPFLLLD